MRKYACYCMTRNIYHKVIPSLMSLLANSDVDKVYLLIEDDDIGFPLPDRVECINVRDQSFFTPNGPNYATKWTYMVMMRVALCKIFPDIDKILSLDCDTLVMGSISHLWETDLKDNYFAAVRETHRLFPTDVYINAGVVLWNLAQMRDGKADEMIHRLNTEYHPFCEQDVMNRTCQGRILVLPSRYNASPYTGMDSPLIRHFAAEPQWYSREEVRKWIPS